MRSAALVSLTIILVGIYVVIAGALALSATAIGVGVLSIGAAMSLVIVAARPAASRPAPVAPGRS